MNLRRSCALLFATLAFAGSARFAGARVVFKCTAANGDVTFQDGACATGSRQTSEDIVAPEPASAEQTPFEKLPTPASEPSTPPPPAPPPAEPAKPPVPPIWYCTRPDDGSHYVSRDGKPTSRWVPAGILGIPQKSLAQSYGPGGGAGVSAPGETKPKILHSPVDKRAGEYVEIDDDCVEASAQKACDYFEDELDNVEHRLRRAFKDERTELETRETQLQHDLEGC